MHKLSPDNLLTLEAYAKERQSFRQKAMSHKRDRRVALGPNATLYFEDFLTMQYQAQEIMRVERIFEEAEILAEVATYNALIPDGDNWKATFMLEYTDVDVRRAELAKLVGVEHQVFVEVEGAGTCRAIADEDLPRSTEDKTSSVHFLRFQFTPEMIAAIRGAASVTVGVEHEHLSLTTPLSETTLASLRQDLEG